MLLVLRKAQIVSLSRECSVNLTDMSNCSFCLNSLRQKIIILILVSLVVVVFQLFLFQNSLTIQLRGKEARTLGYISKILTRYFSEESGSLEKKDDLKGMNSFGFTLEEIEIVDDYRIGDKVDAKNDLEKVIEEVKFHGQNNNTNLQKAQNDFNKSSGMEEKPKGSTKHIEVKTERPTKLNLRKFKTKKVKKKSYFGSLNLHIWDNICGDKVQSLKEFILFPTAPRFRFLVNQFEAKRLNMNEIGVRMFGFIHPNESGIYKFGISSAGNSELWLSNDTKSRNAKLVAFFPAQRERSSNYSGNFKKFSSQISSSVTLKKGGKYYVEVVYKHSKGLYGVEVAWMKPGTSDFQIISGSFLSLAVNDSHIPNNTVTVNDYNEAKSSVNAQGINRMLFMDFIDFEEAFPECEYEPSYYIKEKLVRFQGARNKSNTHFVEVYPADQTNESLPLVMNEDIWWIENNYGNDVLGNETAMHVGKMFNRSFEDKFKGIFKVSKLMSLERVIDKVKGTRYHIQMEVEDVYSRTPFEFSEFLYQPREADYLCFPRSFRWSKYATVNVIVPLKNSGRWALYFIKNIADIVYETRDPHIRVIIVDYESTDIDVEAILKKSSLSRYSVVKLPGNKKFNRAEALQKGADAVKDPHSILFFCDLNLKIPAKLIETVRKHCVEGKMAFAPVVKRLKCGFYPELPIGYWETLGFGLFALYKSDFDRVGGMNAKEFQNWGGEDWELLDRVLESQIEVERLKIPSFYHFYHPGNSRNGA